MARRRGTYVRGCGINCHCDFNAHAETNVKRAAEGFMLKRIYDWLGELESRLLDRADDLQKWSDK